MYVVRVMLIFFVSNSLFGITACALTPKKPLASVSKIDRISESELLKLMPHTPSSLTLDDIVKISRDLDANQVIGRLQSSNTLYDLSPSQSIALSRQGVDSKVLDYLHKSYQLALQNNMADEISRKEKEKRDEVEKIKLKNSQQHHDNFYCTEHYRLNPYGYGGYYGRRFGMGAGWPLGCW
jgi:hypothetical protein